MRANLRVCMSCEWIWKEDGPRPDTGHDDGCPMCGFGHYGAYFAYGRKAYSYAKTQKPWKDQKMSKASERYDRIIHDNNNCL